MADTGAKVLTAVVDDGTPYWSGVTVGNLNADDGNYASTSTNATFIIGSFDFGVPAGATINGIKVDVTGSNATGSYTVNYSVQLSGDGGSTASDTYSDTFTSATDATDTLGGATDLWDTVSGYTWTASSFSNANFLLALARTGGTFGLRIDLVTVTVYYTATTTTTTSTSTSSTSSSSSTSTVTQTLDPSSGGLAFGEESPTEGETPISWQSFSDSAGGKPDVIGDQDWGKMALQLNEKGQSRVYDFGDSTERTYTLTSNRYGTGGGSGGVVYYRGHVDTYFTQDSEVIGWTEYSAPFNAEYQFIQVKVEKTS